LFDILKKEIAVGDRIRLHLVNSIDKPEGTVLEIGEHFVLLKNNNGEKSRFFDKLIGGWDLLPGNSSTRRSKIAVKNSSFTGMSSTRNSANKIIVPLKESQSSLAENLGNPIAKRIPDFPFISASSEPNISIETKDIGNDINKMLQIDLQEHEYTHPLIIKNGGLPDQSIADEIMAEARKTSISKCYYLYLEAAKAYSQLMPGSYELRKFQTASAYYARFKGDTLYFNFRNKVLTNSYIPDELIHIKDSVCSYYLVSTQLLSTFSPYAVVNIITNFLLININLYYIKKGRTITEDSFPNHGSFGRVVEACLASKDTELEKIVWETFVELGSLSLDAWEALIGLHGDIETIYKEFKSAENKTRIHNLINSIWEWKPIDISLEPSDFLQIAFKERQKLENEFEKAIDTISMISFEGDKIQEIVQAWSEVSKYENMLTITDKETEKAINKIIELIKPYLKRTPGERTNILIEIREIIDERLQFINRNTTIYSRAFFFPLLSKWKKDITNLQKERIVGWAPELFVFIDPSYYFEKSDKIIIPLIVRNTGKAISEGFILDGSVESEERNSSRYNFSIEQKDEISAGGETPIRITAPRDIIGKTETLKFSINASAKYLNDTLKPKEFQFTLEKESTSTLTREDIPWNETNTPSAFLFKGREDIINMLYNHYISEDRKKSYILYGLTRTGKSSILTYLERKIDNASIMVRGQNKTLITIEWRLNKVANYKTPGFWQYIVKETCFERIEPLINVNDPSFSRFETLKEWGAEDFKILIDCINNAGFYPLFLVDEFSYITSLIDKEIIDSAFLANLRELSFSDKASFIFAGTYDIKDLINNKKYGITGQLANTINFPIDKIDDRAAEELINVSDRLHFTKEAVTHIKKLSGNIPYFIQIICKECGNYALENKRLSIGYPELEKVINILTGFDISDSISGIKILSDGVFQGNQYDSDPSIAALISSIAWLNRTSITNPRGIRISELEKLWGDHNISKLRQKLAQAIKTLVERKIIISENDEGDVVYKISVDLFRRWWYNNHRDIDLELALIPGD